MTELAEEVKIFLVEAYENLDQVEQNLVELEKNPSDSELLNSVFRSIHTIKGNSGFLAFQKLEQVCHKGETLLDQLRNGSKSFSADIANALLGMIDTIRTLLEDIESSGAEGELCIEDVSNSLASLIDQ